MKRSISTMCLAAAFSAGLLAQSPTTSSPSQPTTDKTMTMTGCLKAGDAPGSFVLANAKSADKSTSASTSSTATTGTTGTAGTASTTSGTSKSVENTTVTLTGSPAGVSLSDHVGHTVQVTGTMAPQSSSAAGATPATPATPGVPAASTGKAQASLSVTSFSMVAGTCPM